jgi:hypothetical protein
MRVAAGIVIFSTALCAQGFINTRIIATGSVGLPGINQTFGNVVFPGGTSATVPGALRTFGNVVFPGGGGPTPIVPSLRAPTAGQNVLARSFGGGGSFGVGGSIGSGRSFGGGGGRRSSGTTIVPYAYPIYIGGYGNYVGGGPYVDPYAASPYGAPPDAGVPPQQPGNVTVIYPPAYPPPQPPVVMNPTGPDQGQTTVTTQGTASPVEEGASHYLIAFKDHTIYSAVAYWVDGDTLHYFTTGSTHNQVSLSLVDVPLTERLNKEAGEDIRLR